VSIFIRNIFGKRDRLLANVGREMQIKDKKVILTGAASGAGLAFSRELLRNGTLVCNLIK